MKRSTEILTLMIIGFLCGICVGQEQIKPRELEELMVRSKGGDKKKQEEQQPVTRPRLLREGFVISGAMGTVSRFEVHEYSGWFFVCDDNLSDTIVTMKAGTAFELLPCNMLEKMTARFEPPKPDPLLDELPEQEEPPQEPYQAESISVRLWGEVVQYEDKNYIYVIYFVPVGELELSPKQQPEETATSDNTENPTSDETDSIIPEDIIAKLKPKRIVKLAEIKPALDTRTDVIMANRTGFLVDVNGVDVFQIDSFGQKIDDLAFRMLPCATLERVQHNLWESIWRQRYRVSGIVTRYHGADYLLLQKAVRTYSHGNFAR